MLGSGKLSGFFQVGEDDANSPLSIFLLHQNWIGEPAWVKGLSDEVGLEEHVNFIVQDSKTLCIHLLRLLLHLFDLGEDRQLVANDEEIHPGHICWGSYEHVKVLEQKLLELVLLSGRKLRAHPENSLWVIEIRKEQLSFLI